MEPGTPHPRQRLRALERLALAGIPCGISMAPVLPGITDDPAALEQVIGAAKAHGAQWLWAGPVHLESSIRDWFLDAVERHFPQAVPLYTRIFGAAGTLAGMRYMPRTYAGRLDETVADLKADYGITEFQRPERSIADDEMVSQQLVLPF